MGNEIKPPGNPAEPYNPVNYEGRIQRSPPPSLPGAHEMEPHYNYSGGSRPTLQTSATALDPMGADCFRTPSFGSYNPGTHNNPSSLPRSPVPISTGIIVASSRAKEERATTVTCGLTLVEVLQATRMELESPEERQEEATRILKAKRSADW